MARFSRKDYQNTARMLSEMREHVPAKQYEDTVNREADRYAEDNPRFRRDLFLSACGIES